MAGYRTATVQSITLGMTTGGVANVAGQPQRREALATANGPIEVWYYVISGPGGALVEHPIVFANNQVVATGKEAVQALVNTPAQQHTETPQQRDEAVRQVTEFYETYPALRGREKCVARVLNARSPQTWGDLASAAQAVCFPAEQWIKVVTDVDGRSTFVDPTRVEVRKGNQVTFWELTEVFDDESDFLLARIAVDCDKKFWAAIGATRVVGGRYGDAANVTELEWLSVLPNTRAEAVLNTICGLRAPRLAKPAARSARPKQQPVRGTPPKVTPSSI
jgi:hypothetical protein